MTGFTYSTSSVEVALFSSGRLGRAVTQNASNTAWNADDLRSGEYESVYTSLMAQN